MAAAHVLLVALTMGPARARAKVPALTPDQIEVVAAVVDDVFHRPRLGAPPLALCLDVETSGPMLDDEALPPPAKRHGRRPPPRKPAPAPRLAGAPPELVARVARPWRVVSSALACRDAANAPLTFGDATHTPAQLVTVHLSPGTAAGSLGVEWTEVAAIDREATSSRTCTAAQGPRGWAVTCGGTWRR
ncbi:MAG TPA: hypothetical protein VHJ20_15850 [Polyangia bacterium]|nr:hypothetical protein [Polyangia bacterium]